jgi:serpin B
MERSRLDPLLDTFDASRYNGASIREVIESEMTGKETNMDDAFAKGLTWVLLLTSVGCSSRLDSGSVQSVAQNSTLPPRPTSSELASDNHGKGQGVSKRSSSFVNGQNQFAFELYRGIKLGKENGLLSPASVSLAMCMLYEGANGNTRQEIAQTLHLPTPVNDLTDGIKLLPGFNDGKRSSPVSSVILATRLWSQEGHPILPAYSGLIQEQFGSPPATLDFERSAATARQTINSWVEMRTEKHISNLIHSVTEVQGARLVLANAVYFKGRWTNAFDPTRTTKGDFVSFDNFKTQVSFMHKEGNFRHARFAGLAILELPYDDGGLSMLILLPDEVNGLESLEKALTLQNYEEWSRALKTEVVSVALPRFQSEAKSQMNAVLASIGVVSAFDRNKADFSRMVETGGVFLSAVVHQALISVDEEGTVATAATAAVARPKFAVVPRVAFKADHPFAFAIRDNRTGLILFLGRFCRPSMAAG